MKKQEIFDKMVEVQGKLKNEFNFDFWLNPRGIDNYIARTSKQELEYELSNLENLYHSKLIESKTNEYYATEDGKKFRNEISQKISALENKCDRLRVVAQTTIDILVKELLGNNWKVSLYNTKLEVCMTNENGECMFGKYFVLRYRHPYGVEKTLENFKYTMTYTLGEISFVEGNEDSVEYVKALGMFVGDKARFDQIKLFVYNYSIKLDETLEEINKLDELKRNPLNL